MAAFNEATILEHTHAKISFTRQCHPFVHVVATRETQRVRLILTAKNMQK